MTETGSMRRYGVDLPPLPTLAFAAGDTSMDGDLDEGSCLELLGSTDLGRVGVSIGALPVIFPVTYCLVGGTLMFFTVDGGPARAALSDTVVAFEADRIDPLTHAGWSVHAVGVARLSVDGSERSAAAHAGLLPPDPPVPADPTPLAPGPSRPGQLVTVRPVMLSGWSLPGLTARP